MWSYPGSPEIRSKVAELVKSQVCFLNDGGEGAMSAYHWPGTQPRQKARVQEHRSWKKHKELWNSWEDPSTASESETEVWAIFTRSSSVSGTLSQSLQYSMVEDIQSMRAQRRVPGAILSPHPGAHLNSPQNVLLYFCQQKLPCLVIKPNKPSCFQVCLSKCSWDHEQVIYVRSGGARAPLRSIWREEEKEERRAEEMLKRMLKETISLTPQKKLQMQDTRIYPNSSNFGFLTNTFQEDSRQNR